MMIEQVERRYRREVITDPERYGITIDVDKAKSVIALALEAREKRAAVFAREILTPEKPFVDYMRTKSEEIGDPLLPLHAVFLITPFVFRDDTEKLFERIMTNLERGDYLWLFDPKVVVGLSADQVAEAVTKMIRPGGHNGNAVPGWHYNLSLLARHYDSDLRKYFQRYGNNALWIVREMAGPIKKPESWPGFHRFGPKLARLFMQWVDQYELYPELEGVEEIGLPVDSQVSRILIQTDALVLTDDAHYANVAEHILTPVLTKICKEMGIKPRVISEILWNIGHQCCNNYRHHACPISSQCTRMISSPTPNGGRFSMKDIGRHFSSREAWVAAEMGQKELPFDTP